MRLRNGLFGICALLAGGAARAQPAEEHYATVGPWEVAAEPARAQCKMYRFYGSTTNDNVEGLVVRHDAARNAVLLTWSTTGTTIFVKDGEIDFSLSFLKAKSIDDSWGSRTFRHGKPGDTRYFASAFLGPKESQRILHDLAGNELIGLYLGPVLMTALRLDAAAATEKLRECSAKIAAPPAG